MEKRIKRELEDLKKQPIEGCKASLINNNDLYYWKATIYRINKFSI